VVKPNTNRHPENQPAINTVRQTGKEILMALLIQTPFRFMHLRLLRGSGRGVVIVAMAIRIK